VRRRHRRERKHGHDESEFSGEGKSGEGFAGPQNNFHQAPPPQHIDLIARILANNSICGER
jgi:hypothetical protein